MRTPDNQTIMREGSRPRTQYNADYFVYALDFGTIVAGASAQGQIQIQADSDFMWSSGTYFSFADGAVNQTVDTLLAPPITVQIIDTGSGRQLFNQQLPVTSVFGTGSLPFILPLNRIFKARSNISFAVSNRNTTVNYQLQLQLIGSKIFSYDA